MSRIEAFRHQFGVRDLVAIVVLVAATWHLVAHNGGRAARDIIWVLSVSAFGLLLLAPTLRGTSRAAVWLFAAWSVAPLIVLLDAEIRAGFVRPITALALAPPVALATIHIWRRPWGPMALGAILAVTMARSWYLTFLAWWGGATGRPVWMALSWHNQSGTLMGAFGVAATATAAVLGVRASGGATRMARAAILIAGGLAGATLAGAWLSGSRGALIATGAGLLAVLVGLARGGELKRATPALAGVMLATMIALFGLETMVASEAGQPLTTREQTAAQNMTERLGYWQAAVGMAASRPLTGWGPGSYRWASVPHYPDHTGLTSSAHNEYLEAMAEGGLVGAGPIWFAALAIAFLAGGVIVRRRDPNGSDLRRAGALAAAGAVVVLGVHAGIDFDWDYPVLLALLAIASAVVWAERSTPEPRPIRPGPVLVAIGGALLLLVVAISAAILSTGGDARWELNRQLAGAIAASDAGDYSSAREHLALARTWNPGASSLHVVAAVVDHRAGEINDARLAETVGPRTASHAEQLLVARRLYESGNAGAARTIVDGLAPVLEARRRWGVQSSAVNVAELTLRTEAALAGCDAASDLAPSMVRWAEGFGLDDHSREQFQISVAEITSCRA